MSGGLLERRGERHKGSSVSSIPRPPEHGDPQARGGETEPLAFSEIRDPVLRTAFEAAYEAWARAHPHLLEDWPA